jgi:KipI family sensor histidine kinase inhibitor
MTPGRVPAVEPYGERALQIVLGEGIDPGLAARCQALADAVRRAAQAGEAWGAPTPGHATVVVPFDPAALSETAATARLGRLAAEVMADPESPAPVPIEIPVRYGGPDGPDLGAVAELTRLSPSQVIEAHASAVYRVQLLGFLPGFAYLGLLPPELAVPRRSEPRRRVAAGSVGLAGVETAVYPVVSPGGWQLIGRTATVLWDARRQPPALLAPGDRVRFVPEADTR